MTDDFARAVRDGLSASPKTLPSRFFYDERGSALFEEITELAEYYPTRTEMGILVERAPQIAECTAPGSVLIEFGSGSSRKTETLIAALDGLAAYVPIDVSASALEGACQRLQQRFPNVAMIPIVGDFHQPPALPAHLVDAPRIGFFPGSTIGNFTQDEAQNLLRIMAKTLGPQGRLIIGVDLRKDISRLLPAYDDALGVTAAFNKNMLTRMNRELGANFDLDQFRHRAVWNEADSRIEMWLESLCEQTVRIEGRSITFRSAEGIHTENSHKYSIPQFQALAERAGFGSLNVWSDPQALFSVHELVVRAL